MTRRRSIHDSLRRLATAETAFLRAEFLAPVLRGAGVQVRIAGVRCHLAIEPADFQGWGVFEPVSHRDAILVRPASMNQRRRYLDLLPQVSLVLAWNERRDRLATIGTAGDSRFAVEGLVPVRLIDQDVDLFDTVVARFDGTQFWYDEADPRADPSASSHLRRSLLANVSPEAIDRPGLTLQQREAFAAHRKCQAEIHAHRRRKEIALARSTDEGRLRTALDHAGAQLRDFSSRGDAYRVTYSVDGRQHASVVSRSDLTVQTAGICLSGEDRKFDLESLVGVLREGAASR